MTTEEFQSLLLHASNLSWNFAKQYVVEMLPPKFIYTVHLNESADDINLRQFDIYPDDKYKVVELIKANVVARLLNKKGKVPVWIDISVKQVFKDFTAFPLLCADRYSDLEKDFYYAKGGTGPFGIKSPTLPPGYFDDTESQ